MTAAGVPTDSVTYTCLIEAAVLSGDIDMAQRVFARAMAAGITNSVQVGCAVLCWGKGPWAAVGTQQRVSC
jgi:pentatricopeptide repeat protein